MPFKFDAQVFFLTYPRCDVSIEELYAALVTVCPVKWARICSEQHADGGRHLHAVGSFDKRFQSKNERIFDIQGNHPNIQRCRSIKQSLGYVSKDGDYQDFGTIPKQQEKRAWTDIVASSQGAEMDWLQVCHEERIQQHVAKRLREVSFAGDEDMDEYDCRPIDSRCYDKLPLLWTSTIVVGPPGIGKTGWAMLWTPRPALLVKHLDTLKLFKCGYHKSIVFDDCDFKHLPRSTQLMICDYENQLQIHVRYGVARIPARVPRIFLCNYGNLPFIEDTAIQGRRVETIIL
nr:MAG: replication associated protein [Cressdnaviricota sp.]